MGADTLTMEKDLIRWAKRRAKKNNILFTIEPEDIEIPLICPVLGIALFKGEGLPCDNSPTLDRIVPELGYVPGNIIVISNRANRIKSNATWRELRLLVDFYEQHICQVWMQDLKTSETTIH